MKKNLTFLLILYSLLSFSQENYNSESYIVTLDDIKSSTFVKDSTANALVIYEDGNSYVDKEEFNLRTEIRHKIKILKREGFDNANVVIHLYNSDRSDERVKKINATTYNLENGTVVKTNLNEKDIFTEKYDENHTLVKFAIPNIKEGSVITYSYTLISHFMFNYKSWDFQGAIPKLYSEYKTSIPANWDYSIKLIGGQKLYKNDSKLEKNCLVVSNGGAADCSNSIYVMKDIPAFIEEDYMTTKSNYLARIEYELKTFQDFRGVKNNYAKTWETVDNELRKDINIGRQLTKSVDTETLLSNDILSETDILKKAQSIYNYVQQNYTWNDEYRIFHEVSVKDLIKNKSGNVSSINILLHNLLQDAGIDVKPILLSTRNNGFATKIFPVISEFNYLIVQATINDKTYLLDATDKYISFGDIPFKCLNGYGRILDLKKGSDWIDIEPEKPSTIQYKVELNLDEKEQISGNVYGKNTGYHALNSRKAYYPNKEIYINKKQDKTPNIEISNHQVLSEGETSSDFVETYNIEFENNLTGDNIYLNPFIIKFFNGNPFKLQERTYPIDFGYKDTYYYTFKLNFSDAYTILEKPKDIALNLPDGKGQIIFYTNLIGNSINMIFKVTFNEAIYAPEYYPYLKEFFNKIVDIQTNSIILLKKK
ncbi:transglutaminase domain-containing protein [Mariniflexile litorale]|uniref:Transglutaminase domain-containing protein n=1 Tax=Mariniflexile litorale TaxID=3045158 RepID=A0AAU7EFZ1_9FLAO|nr:transglutaminase domain-containing protein [Mariniflexile sp. KMM 9835]MDQ8211600.1 hypothetical protein [Mariniflexile sp. KMM 9835]